MGQAPSSRPLTVTKLTLARSPSGGKSIIRILSGKPAAIGRYSTLYEGFSKAFGKVAVKDWYISSPEVQDIAEDAERWLRLSHPNIIAFLGVATDSSKAPARVYLVYPWLDSGSLLGFMSRDPDCDRPKYLAEAADGLAYLHSMKIVHGTVCAESILISSSGKAVVAYYGVWKYRTETRLIDEDIAPIAFLSPELFQGGPRTKESDVYAFGMTIYQVLSDQQPFVDYPSERAIVEAIVEQRERPACLPRTSRSGSSYDYLWQTANDCWRHSPAERPTMLKVQDQLSQYSQEPKTPPPSVPLEDLHRTRKSIAYVPKAKHKAVRRTSSLPVIPRGSF